MGRRETLNDVRIDDKNGIIRADELPKPMGLVKRRILSRYLPSSAPRLLRESSAGIAVYELKELPKVLIDQHDRDETLGLKERAALEGILLYLVRGSPFRMRLEEIYSNNLGDSVDNLTAALEGGNWQQIGYSLARSAPKQLWDSQKIMEAFVSQNTVIGANQLVIVNSKNEETVNSLKSSITQAMKIRDQEGVENLLSPRDLKGRLNGLSSDETDERVEASRSLFNHYTLFDMVDAMPPRDGVIESLLPALGDEDSRARANISVVLGYLNSHTAVETLARLAENDPDPEVREDSSTALGAIDDPKVIAPLVKALHDRELTVRAAAVSAFEGILKEGLFAERIRDIERGIMGGWSEERDPDLKARQAKMLTKLIK